jgi:carbonic anhydrase/acetyltransferase-like protein (isoleucine patch superfamily)
VRSAGRGRLRGAHGHVTPRGGVDIGAGATIGHLCLVHAATIGDEALVGNGSKVLDGATIGARSTGTEIPEGVLAIGARESEGPARRVRRRWSG